MRDSNRSRHDIHLSKLPYRKDIQGLRALAILLVIAAHAKIPGLEGGFIGVDVFFVISGYLITGLLVKELTCDGKISFLQFYARRLKRLLPALALVIVVTALFAYRLLPSTEQLPQTTSAAAAIFWVSNIQFAFQDLDYFGSQADQNIYLHTWSLGVEEQFYLVWPLALAFTFWAAKSRISARIALVTALSIIGVVSFIACIVQTLQDAKLAFYLPLFRAWQFCAGGLVFLLADKIGSNRNISKVTYISGFLLIIGSAIFMKGSMPYPGFLAAIPTLGTALLIIGGTGGPKSVTSKLLENPIAQKIGDISYSWYLWHWPVLILGGLLFPLDSPKNQLLLITLSWSLAIVTYQLFEKPIRSNIKIEKFYGWHITIGLSICIAISIQSMNWQSHLHKVIASEKHSPLTLARMDLPVIYRMGCDDWYHSADVKVCRFGGENAQKHVVMIGDSIGLQWFPAVFEAFPINEWRISVMTKSSCPIVEIPFFYDRIGREYTECSQWREKALITARQLAPDILILGSANYDFKPDQWRDGSKKILDLVADSAAHIYIIRPTPTLPFDAINCLSATEPDDSSPARCSAKPDLRTNTQAWEAVSELSKSYKNVHLLDMNELVCPENVCSAGDRNSPKYRDNMHLTASFTASLAELMMVEIIKRSPKNSDTSEI